MGPKSVSVCVWNCQTAQSKWSAIGSLGKCVAAFTANVRAAGKAPFHSSSMLPLPIYSVARGAPPNLDCRTLAFLLTSLDNALPLGDQTMRWWCSARVHVTQFGQRSLRFRAIAGEFALKLWARRFSAVPFRRQSRRTDARAREAGAKKKRKIDVKYCSYRLFFGVLYSRVECTQ